MQRCVDYLHELAMAISTSYAATELPTYQMISYDDGDAHEDEQMMEVE